MNVWLAASYVAFFASSVIIALYDWSYAAIEFFSLLLSLWLVGAPIAVLKCYKGISHAYAFHIFIILWSLFLVFNYAIQLPLAQIYFAAKLAAASTAVVGLFVSRLTCSPKEEP